MGTMIKAKYNGQCKNCGSSWAVGDDLYYQKNPKALCTDHECFTEQGGTAGYKSSFQKKERDTIVVKLPEITASDGVKMLAELHQQFFLTAHHLAMSYYPEEDITGDRFGQIRSKIIDQLLTLRGNE
jgi:hypothetical protein|tara:strand:- start:1197 stop:1577 length:381 start_codon:yes stop_codon:yes gene_type:complete